MGSITYTFPNIPENPTPEEYAAAVAVPRTIDAGGDPTPEWAAALDVFSKRGEITAACRALDALGAPLNVDPAVATRADVVAHLQQLVGGRVATAVAAEPSLAGKSANEIAAWLNTSKPTTIDRSNSKVIVEADELKRQIDPAEWMLLPDRAVQFIQMQTGPIDLEDSKFTTVLDALFPSPTSVTRQRVLALVSAAKTPIPGPDTPAPLMVIIEGVPHAPNALTDADVTGALGGG